MSATARVSAVSGPPSGAIASAWLASTGRHGLMGPIDPTAPVDFFSLANFGQGGFSDSYQEGRFRRDLGDKRSTPFTPFVGLQASSFAASVEGGYPRAVVDLQRAIALYEFSMKLTSDSIALSGSVVNRIS